MKRKGLILALIALVCLLFVIPSNNSVDAEEAGTATTTLSFASTAQRVSQNGDKQVWAIDFLTFTNNQGSSTSAVIDSSNPVRLYASSEVIIEQKGMISILFECNNSSYATALKNSITGETVTVNGDKVTVDFGSIKDSFTIAKLSAQVRLDGLTVTYIAEDNIKYTGEIGAALHKEFNDYFNGGNYVKDTYINIDINKDAVKDELADIVHAYDPVNKIDVDKTTTYCGDYLYFDTMNGYGTKGDYLTSGKFDGSKFVATTTHTNLPGMETYYLTLKDFVLGVHTSAHTNNTRLDLTQDWTLDGNVYTTTNKDVIAAFALFTAPTWLNLGVDYHNYMSYTKATVEINKDGNLLMKLWVSSTEKDGKLIDDAETVGEHTVFSYATIYDSELNVTTANNAAAEVAELGCEVFEDYSLPTTLDGYDGLEIKWSGDGVSNNELTYLNPTEDTPVSLTATITYKHQTRTVDGIVFTHKVAVEVIKTLATFNLGANGTASHYDGTSMTTYSETNNGYTLSITGGKYMYTGARDAKGNSCIKFGTGNYAGSMTFTVESDVNYVVIYVAKYKTNAATVTINGTKTTLACASNNGEYDVVVINTTTTKTVSFEVSSGKRAMLNTIEFHSSKPNA